MQISKWHPSRGPPLAGATVAVACEPEFGAAINYGRRSPLRLATKAYRSSRVDSISVHQAEDSWFSCASNAAVEEHTWYRHNIRFVCRRKRQLPFQNKRCSLVVCHQNDKRPPFLTVSNHEVGYLR
jgi:hypothetical protein